MGMRAKRSSTPDAEKRGPGGSSRPRSRAPSESAVDHGPPRSTHAASPPGMRRHRDARQVGGEALGDGRAPRDAAARVVRASSASISSSSSIAMHCSSSGVPRSIDGRAPSSAPPARGPRGSTRSAARPTRSSTSSR